MALAAPAAADSPHGAAAGDEAAADQPHDAAAGDDAATDGSAAAGDDAATGDDAAIEESAEAAGAERIILWGRAPRGGVGALATADPVHADAARALADAAFVTVVRIDARADETTSIAETLSQSLGVNVRSLGGLGAFSSISVRGADAGHTTVLVDGVPLSRLGSVSVDLNRYALTSFSELELYRGAVPAALGGAALGGALNLVTRVGRPADGERARASVGGGSFGARHARGRLLAGDVDGRWGAHISAGYAEAAGDFVYYNDNGTNLVATDDRYQPRSNNGYQQLDSVARLRLALQDWRIEGGARLLWKSQGVPGAGSMPSSRAHLETFGPIADVALERQGFAAAPNLALLLRTYGSLEWQHYDDRGGEVGVGSQDRRYRTQSVGVIAELRALLGSHRVSVAIDDRIDWFRERDLLSSTPRTSGRRVAAALSVADELTLFENRLVVTPAVRLDVNHTQPVADSSSPVQSGRMTESVTDLAPSPRLAARWSLTPAAALKGSVGWYFRAPTVFELFGDRGYILGNPRLESETGPSADLGVVLAPSRPVGIADRLYLETAGFVRQPRNAIGYVRASGNVSAVENLGDALIWGVESGASVRLWTALTLSGNYTLLASRRDSPVLSFDGKRLPQRPLHQLYGRAELGHYVGDRLLHLWTDASYADQSFLDGGNNLIVPTRRLIGAGFGVDLHAGLRLAIEAKNLADQRTERVDLARPSIGGPTSVLQAVADFSGYPLPGRSYYLTAEWRQ